MQWAAKDGETLVVITADHETGGLTVHGGDLKTGTVIAHFSTKEHTGTIVPIYAFGPGSEQFTGFMDNTEVFWKIKKLLKISSSNRKDAKENPQFYQFFHRYHRSRTKSYPVWFAVIQAAI